MLYLFYFSLSPYIYTCIPACGVYVHGSVLHVALPWRFMWRFRVRGDPCQATVAVAAAVPSAAILVKHMYVSINT